MSFIKRLSNVFYETPNGVAILDDSFNTMKNIPNDSIDLIFTSPPFALTRKKEGTSTLNKCCQ